MRELPPQPQQPQQLQQSQPPCCAVPPPPALAIGAGGPRGADTELAIGFAVALTKMSELASISARMTCFHSVRPPGMPLRDYMGRIHHFLNCGSACYVLGLIYIDRVIKSHPEVVINALSCHRLLLVSTVVAAKFYDDTFYSNAFYAKVGGVNLKELNGLEFRFLQLLGWKCHVHPEEYGVYQGLCKAAALAKD